MSYLVSSKHRITVNINPNINANNKFRIIIAEYVFDIFTISVLESYLELDTKIKAITSSIVRPIDTVITNKPTETAY